MAVPNVELSVCSAGSFAVRWHVYYLCHGMKAIGGTLLVLLTSTCKETNVKITKLTVLTSVLLSIGALAGAQQAGFKRTVLQQGDASVPGREFVMAVAEFQPGASSGRHTHPGDEIAYILEGTVVIAQDGKPEVTLGPGKTFHIPEGTVHNATDSGSTAARILATYVVEKGKPLATPAPTK